MSKELDGTIQAAAAHKQSASTEGTKRCYISAGTGVQVLSCNTCSGSEPADIATSESEDSILGVSLFASNHFRTLGF